MNVTGAVFVASIILSTWYLSCRIRVNFTLSSVGLLLLLALHGPAYWYYTRYWIRGESFLNKRHDAGAPPPTLAPAYDHLQRLFTDSFLPSSLARLDIAMAILFAGTILGYALVDRAIGTRRAGMDTAISCWQNSKTNCCLKEGWCTLVFWTFIAVCGLAMAILYIQSHKVGLVYQYFFSTASEVEKIRWRREYGGFPYLWNLFFSTIAIFATVYALVEMRFTKIFGPLLTVSFVVLVIVGKMAYLSKAPIIVYVLQICLAMIIARSLKVSGFSIIALLALIICSTLSMIFVANSGMHGVTNALVFLFYRVFMIPNESLVEYFLAFPKYLPHTHGLDNRFIAFFYTEPKLLESYWRTAAVIRGVGGSTTTAMFIADAWAQFAWSGVIAFPVAFGCILRGLDIFLVVNLGKTSTTIAGLSLGYYGIFTALNTSLFTALLTGGLLMIPLLVIISSLISSVRPIKTTEAG